MATLPYANRLLDSKIGSVWLEARRPDISVESAGWTFDENPDRLSVHAMPFMPGVRTMIPISPSLKFYIGK
jgi:hypothetical protein